MVFSSRACAYLVLFLTVGLVTAVGCGSPPEQPIAVSGKVTFKGEPVTEGTVQFIDDATGRGAQAELGADGAYNASLIAGNYKVLVAPPYLVDNSSGMPNPKYKKVNNIPAKYHSNATSGFSAIVASDKATHNFELVP